MRDLAAVLQEELAAVRETLAVCHQEQECLKKDDIAGIEAATVLKGDLARRLSGLEQEREQILKALLSGVGRNSRTIAGAEPGSGDYGPDIENLRGLLRVIVRELQEVNETNRFLARQSLAYVQKMVSLLLPDGEAPGTVDRVI